MQGDKKRTLLGFMFPSVSIHHSTATPLKKKHSPSFFSSHSPPNPSLLHCICFLIQSVWEAHEPQEPPDHPPRHLPFCHWLQCCNPPPFDFLSAPFCCFFFSLPAAVAVCMHLPHFFACHYWGRCFTPANFLSLRLLGIIFVVL